MYGVFTGMLILKISNPASFYEGLSGESIWHDAVKNIDIILAGHYLRYINKSGVRFLRDTGHSIFSVLSG